MSTDKESLREQSNRIKQKVNSEVEAIFDNFMHSSSEKAKDSQEVNLKHAYLKGLIDRVDMLKKIKDAICE